MRRAAALALLLTLASPVRAQDEDSLLRLWNQHALGSNAPAAAATACRTYAEQRAADPLSAVARSLAGWQYLRAGMTNEAVALLTPQVQAGPDALGLGVAQLAKSWLTRVDRERVKPALQFYYRKQVRYPYSLTELRNDKRLPAELLPPERDRWDETWRYKLVGFKNLPNLLDQKYELLSATLGAGSDLAAALAVPCGERITLKPVRVRTTAVAGREVVEFARASGAGGPVLLTVGQPSDGLLLAYCGRGLLILCDHHHWKLMPRPPGP